MYSYVLNNPLKYTDPSGESYEDYGSEYNHGGNDYQGGETNAPVYYVDGVRVGSAFAGGAMIGAEDVNYYMSSAAQAQANGNLFAAVEFRKSEAGRLLSEYFSIASRIKEFFNPTSEKVINVNLPEFTVTATSPQTWEEWFDSNSKEIRSEMGWGNDKGNGRTIIYQRTTTTNLSTIGSFSIPGTDINGYFLEPSGPSTTTPNQNKRIPAGTYNLEWNTGSKYPNALRLYNDQVPKSRAILIHTGNYPEDTRGCLLPGCSFGVDAVWTSGVKFKEIIDYFNKIGIENTQIIINDSF